MGKTDAEHMIAVGFRIPKTLRRLVEEYVRRDTHASISDFFRDALREKILRDAPQLHARLFDEKEGPRDE